MSEDIKIEIPPEELAKLSAEIERKLKYSKETLQECVNHTAQNWAFKSLESTDKVSAEKIEWELGKVASALKYSKNGKRILKSRRGGSVFREDSLAARIIESKLRKAGKPLIFGQKLNEAIKRLVAARKRAAGFIKSGFIKAIRDFSRFTKTPIRVSSSQARQYGRPKGYGIPAKEIFEPEAVIVNTATKNSTKAAAVAQTGMIRAIPKVVADMQAYTERKMQESMNK